MESNIIFNNVKAYNVTNFDVKLNEKFKVELVNGEVSNIRWFSDNDSVLSISVNDNGDSANIETTSIGKCEIQLQRDNQIVKTLHLEVYDNIAVSLNPQPGDKVLK